MDWEALQKALVAIGSLAAVVAGLLSRFGRRWFGHRHGSVRVLLDDINEDPELHLPARWRETIKDDIRQEVKVHLDKVYAALASVLDQGRAREEQVTDIENRVKLYELTFADVRALLTQQSPDVVAERVAATLLPQISKDLDRRENLSYGQRILVVEDHEHERELITEELTEQGHQVIAVGDGTTALYKIHVSGTRGFDLVITDVKMAPMSGFELIKDIRKQGHFMPIIVISGVDNIETLEKLALEAGADAALAKPFSGEDLALVLRRLGHTRRGAR